MSNDSALLVSGKDVLEIEEILSVELGAVNEWSCENRLSLHLGKTQSIVFGSKKRISKCSELHVTCNGSVIGSESEVTYLGAILDQTLSGASTARSIITKSTNKLTDDTSLVVNGKDLNALIQLLNTALIDLCTWFKANRLSLNTTKTFYI